MSGQQSAAQVLQSLAEGGTDAVVSSEERQYKMVENGRRVPNPVMRAAAKQLKEKGFSDAEIVQKILFFDELAEKDQLIDYLNKQEKEKK
ncbi:hypothetical protein JW978_02205 [Candidatus Dojkabacteria bacterium]|nr:hypothetical protein [Candidatus Dojkabacteria bacterium]